MIKELTHIIADVFTVCVLRTDLTVVPRELFQKKTNEAGGHYYSVEFSLTMRIRASLVFSFVFKGKEYSSVEAKFA